MPSTDRIYPLDGFGWPGDGSGGVTWSNASNIDGAPNGQYADATVLDNNSEGLYAGFAATEIPGTITAIYIGVKGKVDNITGAGVVNVVITTPSGGTTAALADIVLTATNAEQEQAVAVVGTVAAAKAYIEAANWSPVTRSASASSSRAKPSALVPLLALSSSSRAA